MVQGAFKRFEHDHFFSSEGSGCIVRDRFEYTSPLGWLGRVADWLFLEGYMERLLRQRNSFLKAAAEAPDWSRFLAPTSQSQDATSSLSFPEEVSP